MTTSLFSGGIDSLAGQAGAFNVKRDRITHGGFIAFCRVASPSHNAQMGPVARMINYSALHPRSCEDNNVLVVAAAGNDGCACLHVPAAVPSVLAVGADGKPLETSNWGEAYRSNGILAPYRIGESVPEVTVPPNPYDVTRLAAYLSNVAAGH